MCAGLLLTARKAFNWVLSQVISSGTFSSGVIPKMAFKESNRLAV